MGAQSPPTPPRAQRRQIAGSALKTNIATLGPIVLPVGEQLRYFANLIARRLVRGQLPLPRPLCEVVQTAARAIVPLRGVRDVVGFVPADPAEATPADFMHQLPPYVPDFTRAFEWICVHTGGRAVIDAIEKNLSLPPHYLEPSRTALWRFGNTSSASIWYELEIIAEEGNTCGAQREGGGKMPPPGGERTLSKGDRVWQIAFGSGFKCNSLVWEATNI